MKEIGLYPSDTHAPGGKEVGQSVGHYIVKNGEFDKAFKKIPKKLILPFECMPEYKKHKKATSKNKVKYTCLECDSNAWGKPELNIICGDCDCTMKVIEED